MKTLVVGWFSFENGHATAGDLLSCDLVCRWLTEAGYLFDVAVVEGFGKGVDWRLVNIEDYSQVIFICGPFEQGALETVFLEKFGKHRLIGLNLSMKIPLDEWNPFDYLIERDSSVDAHPDIVFFTKQPYVPVVGICLVEEYQDAFVKSANNAIQQLLASKEMSIIEIDTRLDVNSTGLRSPAEIESLIARVDALITTRLHGMVFALKNGVPVVAIDPETGGAKIWRQAKTIGWPVVFKVDSLSVEALKSALNYCLTKEAQAKAQACAYQAKQMVRGMHDEFIAILTNPADLEERYQARLAGLKRGAASEAPSEHSQQDATEMKPPPNMSVLKIFNDLIEKFSRRVSVK